MALYVSGRLPSLSVGIPGITTSSPVLDVTGRIGIGTTNPSADIDLNTIRIRQSIFDYTNSSGSLGYFLTKDAVGIKWVAVPAVNNNALFVSQNSIISGVSSYTGLNFISDGNDLVAISTNSGNTNIVDIKINSYWNKSGNTGIYTSKFVGIGSTSPTVALDVIGNSRISGIVTIGVGNTGIVINGTTGIVTSISGVTTVTYYGNLIGSASTAGYARTAFSLDATAASNLIIGYAKTAGIATYATNAGIATNLKGNSLYSIPYQSGTDSTSFLSPNNGLYLKSNGSGSPPSWDAPIGQINVSDTTNSSTYYPLFVQSSGSTSSVSINQNLFSFIPLSNNPKLGIGTGSPTYNLDVNGTGRFIGTVSADIYYGKGFVGSALSISGISTLGTVKISSGIITATSGIVTYYGDGQYLENVSGVRVEFQELTGEPVYPTLANNTGVSSIGIIATGDNALVFIPSNGSLGIGTTNPTAKLDVNGDIRLRSGLYDYTNSIGIANSILVSTGSSVVWSSLSQLGGSDITIQVDESTPEPQYLVFTNATSGSTYTEKVSPTKLTYIASSGHLGIGTSIPSTPLSVEKYGVKTGFGTFIASAGITTDVDNFLISDTNFKTAEYTVHIESSTSIQAQKVLVMQNGTSAFAQEYGIMYDPTFIISIGATVSGGRCKLQFTPESGISGLMTYRFTRETMK
jgi:hypothetical protein